MNAIQLDILYPATSRNQFTSSEPMQSPARTALHQALNVPGDFQLETSDHAIDLALVRYLQHQQALLEFFTDSLESLE